MLDLIGVNHLVLFVICQIFVQYFRAFGTQKTVSSGIFFGSIYLNINTVINNINRFGVIIIVRPLLVS